MHKTIIPLILIALLGLHILGSGITGYVVSQTCCFPPDCEEEYLCDNQKTEIVENFDSNILLGTGILVIVVLTSAAFMRKQEVDIKKRKR